MDAEKILFGPDHNLAYYVQRRTQKKIIPVPRYGLCPTHHQITGGDLLDAREKYPDAELVVHPECIPEIQEVADKIASTEGIIKYCRNSGKKEFLIGTEVGILHRLRKEIPGKKFYPLSTTAVCPHMKMHTLQKVRNSLQREKPRVKVEDEVARKAGEAIRRMLELTF
jgi:quinolinate synthase